MTETPNQPSPDHSNTGQPTGNDPDDLLNLAVDLPGGGTFSINDFIGQLEDFTQKLMEESAQAQAVLAQASGEATVGPVSLAVDAAGGLTGVRFDASIEDTSHTVLSRSFMQAHHLAVREANRKVSSAMPADFASMIQDAAPADPRQDGLQVDTDSHFTPQATTPRAVPKDAAFDAWLESFDVNAEPADLIKNLKATAPFSVPDLEGKTGDQVNAEFRAENQRISDNVSRMRPEIEALRASADSKLVEVTTNAGGNIVDIAFHLPATRATPEELAEAVKLTSSQAASEASARLRDLLSSGGMADETDFDLFTSPTHVRDTNA